MSPAISSSTGRKTVYPDIHEDLLITGNRMEAAPRLAIDLKSTRNAVVRDNVIVGTTPEPIAVTLSSGDRVENNRVVRPER